MAYKDKALQRETTRLRVRRYRDKQRDTTAIEDVTPAVRPYSKEQQLKRSEK